MEDLFRSKLKNIINLRHELVRLGELMDWARLEAHFAPYYSEPGHRPLVWWSAFVAVVRACGAARGDEISLTRLDYDGTSGSIQSDNAFCRTGILQGLWGETAIICSGKKVTFAQVAEHVNRVGNESREFGNNRKSSGFCCCCCIV